MKLRLLDTFCGAGGAGMGYYRAGFEVVGVDIEPQPRYPFKFHRGDALEFIERHGREFDVIHASPPCQAYSQLNNLHKKEYPDLIDNTRKMILGLDKPYIIENVPGSPLINPIQLCGTMFNLLTLRHRIFETKPIIWFPPSPCCHWGKTAPKGTYSIFENGIDFITVTGNNFRIDQASIAMQIDWMTRAELAQAIPPAYTEWLGKQIIEALK